MVLWENVRRYSTIYVLEVQISRRIVSAHSESRFRRAQFAHGRQNCDRTELEQGFDLQSRVLLPTEAALGGRYRLSEDDVAHLLMRATIPVQK